MRLIRSARKARRFANPWPHAPHGVAQILGWKVGLTPKDKVVHSDESAAPWIALSPTDVALPPGTGWRVVWLGHSSFLLQGAGLSLLIDPVFSEHCSPIPWPAFRRLLPPPLTLSQLPRVDAVLITHGHYDHLDLSTLRRLGRDVPLFVPLGHDAWLRRKGLARARALAWWESIDVDGVTITAAPAQHFSARSLWDKNLAHWCGWIVQGAGLRLFHTGDTAWCPAFQEIGHEFGLMDLAMLPIGAYSPRAIMKAVHVSPEEAVRIHLAVRARRSIACHWGVFRLTDEPMGEPPARLRAEMLRLGLPPEDFSTVPIGRPIVVGTTENEAV